MGQLQTYPPSKLIVIQRQRIRGAHVPFPQQRNRFSQVPTVEEPALLIAIFYDRESPTFSPPQLLPQAHEAVAPDNQVVSQLNVEQLPDLH